MTCKSAPAPNRRPHLFNSRRITYQPRCPPRAFFLWGPFPDSGQGVFRRDTSAESLAAWTKLLSVPVEHGFGINGKPVAKALPETLRPGVLPIDTRQDPVHVSQRGQPSLEVLHAPPSNAIVLDFTVNQE